MFSVEVNLPIIKKWDGNALKTKYMSLLREDEANLRG